MTEVQGIKNGKDIVSQEIQVSSMVQQSFGQENKPLEDSKTPQQFAYDIDSLSRPDIYGLTAIATIHIILYHAYPSIIPGGFIGFDVILVITGYLTSSMIIIHLQQNQFSCLKFYTSRIHKITPTLLLIMLFIFFSAFKTYQQWQMKSTTQSLTASSIFSTNIQLLISQKNYFDPILRFNPLKHLWIVGVEEQFSVIIPWILFFLVSRKSIITPVLVILTLSSFTLGIVMSYENSTFSFYFPLCRFWQLFIGGLIAQQKITIPNKIIINILSAIGLISILSLPWIMNQNSLLPGWWALMASLSSVSIIQAGPDSFINKHLLASKPFIFIGKISTSLYLWHWPILVLSTVAYSRNISSVFTNQYIGLLICVVLALITYHFVEQKIKLRKQKIVLVILVLLLLTAGIASFLMSKTLYHEQQIQIEDIPIQLQIGGNDTAIIQYLKVYQKHLIPGKQDFYIKNGKKLPNSSKNPKRQSTTVEKLKACKRFNQWYFSVPRPHQNLDKPIDQNSKYFEQNKPQITLFEVANEGRQKELFLVGDSHTRFLGWRVQYHFEKAKKQNRLNKFPTVVEAIKQNTPFINANKQWVDFAHNFIKKHKPQRLLMAHRWLGYWKFCYKCPAGMKAFSDEHFQIIKSDIQYYSNIIHDVVNLGIDVYVATIHIDDQRMDPQNMHNQSGVIETNLAPIKLSQFRKKYQRLIQLFESNLKNAGAKLIDLSDSHCWQDTCHVLSPSGYPFFIDDNHHSKLYSRYWASSIDFIVDF